MSDTIFCSDIMARRVDVRGVMLFNMSPAEHSEVYDVITSGLASDSFRAQVKRSYRLDQAPQAHEDIMGQEGHLGKLVIRPWQQ